MNQDCVHQTLPEKTCFNMFQISYFYRRQMYHTVSSVPLFWSSKINRYQRRYYEQSPSNYFTRSKPSLHCRTGSLVIDLLSNPHVHASSILKILNYHLKKIKPMSCIRNQNQFKPTFQSFRKFAQHPSKSIFFPTLQNFNYTVLKA